MTVYDNMVHYDPSISAAPKAPTLCPKCGSHRTEIVGTDRDGGILIVRCNACGARSEVPNPAHSDGFASEADAAADCGDVLA